MENKMDAETSKNFLEGQAFYDLTISKGWALAKDVIITPTLLDLQSVNNIKHSSVTDMAREVYARQLACEYMMEILKAIEGRGQQHEANKSLMTPQIEII